MPARIRCAERVFDHVETFKHDFFAATGCYRDPESHRLVVAKINRRNDLWSIPGRWIGRILASREAAHYRAARGIAGVPAFVGTIGDTGIVHEFVAGRPLGRVDRVGDAFFDQLESLLSAIHARRMAYVDLNKRQNIIHGDDGRPYLVDFQIALLLPPTGVLASWPFRWLLRRLQAADRYHFLKHKRRLRPDLLTTAERAEVERISVWIRLHRAATRPFTQLRRRTKRRLEAAESAVVAGAGAK